jgi:hypothetical protein
MRLSSVCGLLGDRAKQLRLLKIVGSISKSKNKEFFKTVGSISKSKNK